MLLRRFISGCRHAAVIATAAIVSACAPSGQLTTEAPPETEGLTAAEPEMHREIPAEAATQFERAVAALAAGDLIDAEFRFEEFVLLYPDYPGAYVNLAIIYGHNNDDDAAKTAVDSALALDAEHPAALNQLGMLLRKKGKFIEAEAAYMKAVTVSPEYALAHYNLGVLNELYLQRLDEALRHFKAYQSLIGDDKQVEKWIADLERRVAANQRAANAAN